MDVKHIEAIFLDRDGTIGGDETVHYPGKFELFPYTASLIEKLKNDKIKIFSFTNQPGISRGLAKVEEFKEELIGFGFDRVYICPHDHKEGCSCRKPGIGMLLEAKKAHNLTLENCVVIGDRWSDMLAAEKAGCIKILVKTGSGTASLNEYFEKIKEIQIDYIADDLKHAVSWLYNHYHLGNDKRS
jgi:histidinol-phosphate phosphatase family protein